MAVSKKEYTSLVFVVCVLVASVLLVRAHAEAIASFIDRHVIGGVFLYMLLNILDAVLAPGATLPLIPIAARVWGRLLAAAITTAGWTTGSLVAFLIARRYGSPVVSKLTSIKHVRRMRERIPRDLFWSIVLLRLVMPMDVISYVLGLFSRMTWEKYLLATALGLMPSALALAYLGKLPHAFEIITAAIGLGAAAWILFSMRRPHPESHSHPNVRHARVK